MTTTYLANAFSLSMLELGEEPMTIKVRKIPLEEVKRLLSGGFISAIGHSSTASALSKILGINVPTNRINITLKRGSALVVFQLKIGRLPQGKELGEKEIMTAWQNGDAYFVLVTVE